MSEGSWTLAHLRTANAARQQEWCANGQSPDLAFRGVELAGETGEACNIIKKLERERLGWPGSRATADELAQELADVVICADLAALTAGIDLMAAVRDKFNATSEKVGLSTRLAKPTRPVRIQRRRTKGFDLQAASLAVNGRTCVYVGRGSIWGNPFTVKGCRNAGYKGTDKEIHQRVTDAYRAWLTTPYWRDNWDSEDSEASRALILKRLPELHGKNLACWCPPDLPCHADILLELVNADTSTAKAESEAA